MTTTPHRARPARRRRHARPIASLADLVGGCAEAAAEIYRPIATAPPQQRAVGVAAGLLYVRISLTAATVLDRARAEDDARWPGAVSKDGGSALLGAGCQLTLERKPSTVAVNACGSSSHG